MAARTHRLDVACRLAEVLVDVGSAAALALIDEVELPLAVFDASKRAPHLVNAAWRVLFGDADVLGAHTEDVAKSGIPTHFAERLLEVNGRPVHVAATLRPSRKGSRARVIVACIDISDEVIARQLAVDELALVWSGSRTDEADYVNQRWSTYVASTSGWQSAIYRDELAKCTKSLARAVRERGSVDIEARVRRADGDFRWHRVRFTCAGSRWYGSAVDFDDAYHAREDRNELLARLKAAKADAETASRLKDQFLAVVSHELRAPLTTIVLWEGVIRDDTAAPALRAKALEAIRQSALSQSKVVGDLLDVSRAIAGKLHIDLRSIAVANVIRASIEAQTPAALAKQITITYRDTVVNAHVDGDPVRLRQVLDNLLSNAVRFTDAGGQVGVVVVRRGRSIVIDIVDTGRGITAELLPRMFDPFSQAEDALTRGAGGLGLGLAIAKQLVQLHGGTLVAASDGPNRGATMTITLPAVEAAQPSSTPSAAVMRTPALARTRVLVIDDDQRVREALAVLLDRAGAVVDTAESAEAGRVRIADDAPDVVVCDIAMPGEDGYSFIRTLRAARNTVGAIALTAYASEADVGRALAAGFDRHLAKPIDFERLVASIDELAVARRAP